MLSPQPQYNHTAGKHAVSLALPESTGFTMHVHSDYNMRVYYFYSEHVSGPHKNIYRLQSLVWQLTGPPITPGLALQELRFNTP